MLMPIVSSILLSRPLLKWNRGPKRRGRSSGATIDAGRWASVHPSGYSEYGDGPSEHDDKPNDLVSVIAGQRWNNPSAKDIAVQNKKDAKGQSSIAWHQQMRDQRRLEYGREFTRPY